MNITTTTINGPIEQISAEQVLRTKIETSALLLTGSFVGAEDEIHDKQGIQKAIPLRYGRYVLGLADLVATYEPDLYVNLSEDKIVSDFINLDRLKTKSGN